MSPRNYPRLTFPDGKKFAFTIIDDTDGATVDNVKPVYDLLHELGMRTTKTVWVLPTNDPEQPFNRGQTLQDSEYVAFLKSLKENGFELASHGARGGSSRRQEVLDSFLKFEEMLGCSPRIFVNHAWNKDNLYWGIHKLDFWVNRLLYRILDAGVDSFGQIPDSPYFWGDYAREHIAYVPKFSFPEINILKTNSRIPYYDPRRPLVNAWFQTAHGEDVESFNELLAKDNLDALESEGGVCIVYTHLAYGFCENGRLNAVTRERLTDLSGRNGWFVPASDILDFLRSGTGKMNILPWRKRVAIELRWILARLHR